MTTNAIARGVIVPFGVLVVAFLVLFFAGMVGTFGPLDLNAANGLVIALWVLAPVAGGLLLTATSDREVRGAGLALGALLGLAVVAFLIFGAGTASDAGSCATGFPRSFAAFVFGIVSVGTVVGLGTGASLIATARLARRSWLGGSVSGGLISLGTGVAANALFYSIVTCLRP